MKLSDFTSGTRIWSQKWQTHGTVDHPARTLVHVLMDNTQAIRALPVGDLSIVTETRAQREFREPPSPLAMPKRAGRLGSSRFALAVTVPEPKLTHHQQRVQKRAGGSRDISRMMIRNP